MDPASTDDVGGAGSVHDCVDNTGAADASFGEAAALPLDPVTTGKANGAGGSHSDDDQFFQSVGIARAADYVIDMTTSPLDPVTLPRVDGADDGHSDADQFFQGVGGAGASVADVAVGDIADIHVGSQVLLGGPDADDLNGGNGLLGADTEGAEDKEEEEVDMDTAFGADTHLRKVGCRFAWA